MFPLQEIIMIYLYYTFILEQVEIDITDGHGVKTISIKSDTGIFPTFSMFFSYINDLKKIRNVKNIVLLNYKEVSMEEYVAMKEMMRNSITLI